MSALGQKQTFHVAVRESALPPKADITAALQNVRLVPKADIPLSEGLVQKEPGQVSSRCATTMLAIGLPMKTDSPVQFGVNCAE